MDRNIWVMAGPWHGSVRGSNSIIKSIEEHSEGHLQTTSTKVLWDDQTAPPDWLRPVDIARERYWKNDDRTFVFVLPSIEEFDNKRLNELISFLGHCRADEFSTMQIYKMTVVRLCGTWWTETFGL